MVDEIPPDKIPTPPPGEKEPKKKAVRQSHLQSILKKLWPQKEVEQEPTSVPRESIPPAESSYDSGTFVKKQQPANFQKRLDQLVDWHTDLKERVVEGQVDASEWKQLQKEVTDLKTQLALSTDTDKSDALVEASNALYLEVLDEMHQQFVEDVSKELRGLWKQLNEVSALAYAQPRKDLQKQWDALKREVLDKKRFSSTYEYSLLQDQVDMEYTAWRQGYQEARQQAGDLRTALERALAIPGDIAAKQKEIRGLQKLLKGGTVLKTPEVPLSQEQIAYCNHRLSVKQGELKALVAEEKATNEKLRAMTTADRLEEAITDLWERTVALLNEGYTPAQGEQWRVLEEKVKTLEPELDAMQKMTKQRYQVLCEVVPREYAAWKRAEGADNEAD